MPVTHHLGIFPDVPTLAMVAGAQAVPPVNTMSAEGEACNYTRQETELTKLHVFQLPTSEFNNIACNYRALQRVMSRTHSICALGIFSGPAIQPRLPLCTERSSLPVDLINQKSKGSSNKTAAAEAPPNQTVTPLTRDTHSPRACEDPSAKRP